METIAVLGTGAVGKAIGNRLISLGYSVIMGSRTADNPKSLEWAAAGDRASADTFAGAASRADIVFNCTKGEATLEALGMAGRENLKGKLLIDLSNPLDFSGGMPPSLFPQWSNTSSLGEAVQHLLPDTKVVKTLNIVNCDVMVNPSIVTGELSMFTCGNDADAKARTVALLREFGWKDILDLGDIKGARGMEMILPLWIRSWGVVGHAKFGLRLVR
jgi:8-hydroxy-5-deazaflavin:NADPH oxidoreductase